MELYIVRHGSTELNEAGQLRGWLDPDLSELGRKQAVRLSGHFVDFPINQVFTSDLQRASDTAAAIAIPHGLEVQWNEMLRPINFGDLQGRPLAEIKPEMDALFAAWSRDLTVKAPNGESFAQFQDRIQAFLAALVKDPEPGECIVIVTHTRVCSYLMAVAFNDSRPLLGPDLRLLNGAEVRTGNYANLRLAPNLLLTELNRLEQIEGEPQPDADGPATAPAQS
jgi:broad specificity phosphatase PhoE